MPLSLITCFLILSAIIYSIVPFFGPIQALIALVPVFASRWGKKTILVASLSGVVSVVFYSYMVFRLGLPSFEIISGSMIRYLISDLGSQSGIGVFLALLGLIGLYASWKRKHRYISLYATLIAILILAPFDPALLIYLALIASFFASFALIKLFRREWQLTSIKEVSMLLIICGILFSIISYTGNMIAQGPSIEEIKSLKVIDGNVLTDPSQGAFVSFVSGYPVVMDDSASRFNDNSKTLNDTRSIFMSRNLIRTKDLLETYDVRYIWLTEESKTMIWGKEEEGLLFLFRNNETFKKVDSDTGIAIWEIIPPER